MNTVYVLIMLWSTGTSQGGITSVAAEFNSWETCEAARAHLAKSSDRLFTNLVSQGCFKKG